MKMPFGRYKGEDMEDLPTSYLYWLASNLDSHPQIQQEAEEQLNLREGRGRPVSRQQAEDDNPGNSQEE